MWCLQIAGIVFLLLQCSKAESNEELRLLDDSFAEAYDENRLKVPFATFPNEERPEKRYIVPRQRVAEALNKKSRTNMIRPVYQPYRPAVIARQYYSRPQYSLTPQRGSIFHQHSPMLPQKVNYLQSPKRNIASFARRNPYYTKQPRMLTAPRRNTVVVSRGNQGYQQRVFYYPNMYNNLLLRNPMMSAQRRQLMHRNNQHRLLPYLARWPKAYGPVALRSMAPRFYYGKPIYAVRSYRPRPYLHARDQSLSGNHLNLNMGTSSHTQSHTILKAPGHTSTDTHVVNKQQTGGRVRGVAPGVRGKQAYLAPKVKYPFTSKGFRFRDRVSASAKVNAKTSSAPPSSSKSSSSSTSNTNGGSRTTSSGGWGGGAGAGWGSGPNAWGIGYGGGGGGSNWKIPSGMTGIPGMPGKFPGIPQGFPGMPPGGYPSQGTYTGASQQSNNRRPSSTLKGKKVSLKPKKGVNEKAFKKPQRIGKPKPSAQKVPAKLRTFPVQSKSRLVASPGTQGKMYRVQYFTSDPLKRPASEEWQKLRQRIISDVLQG